MRHARAAVDNPQPQGLHLRKPPELSKRVGPLLIAVLKEAEAGAKVLDLCRKHGISDATFYNWKAKYGGVTVADLRRLKELEAENAKLKRIVADQALDNAALKDPHASHRPPAHCASVPATPTRGALP
jgi:putative transposase